MNKKPRSNRRPAYKPKGKPGVTNAVKKYVKKVTARTRPEMKCVKNSYLESTTLSTATVDSSLRWNQFVSMLQGTARDQRIGNEIYLHGFHAKGQFYNNGTVPVFIRRLVLGFTVGISTIGTTATELFDNGSGAGVTIATIGNNMGLITAPINKVQFKVYFDKVTKLSPSTATDGTQTKLYNHFQKFGGKKIMFEGDNAATLAQNHRLVEIYLLAEAGNDASTGITVEQTQNFATYFTDP